TVYVDVTASSTNLMEGAGVTYTVTLRNQDGLEVKNHGGLNITLSNGVKITIPAGQDSATSSEVKAPLGSNTIKVQTIVETAKADSGKQFEDIQSGKTVTVNASSSTLKNDTAIATENGSENIASEDSLDTINGKNDGQTASGNVLSNDTVNNDTIVSKITFEGKETIVKSDGNTEIVGKYGTLTINSKGEYTYKVNDENSDVDALNIGDKLADNFTYVTSNGKTAVLTVEVEGRNDAPIISKIETNGVTLTGIYNDYQKDNITKDITAHDLLKEDKGVIFNNENSNLSMNLGNSGTDVSISYLGGNGSYKNILGFYEIDANGNKINLKIMHIDKNSNFENLSSNPQELTQLKNLKGEIGFFLISDGYSNKDIKDAIDKNWAMTVDKSNNIIFKKGNYTVKADKVFYSNETSNNDGLDHTIALKQNNGLIIGFEDQYGGGDKDYDDFVISVKFTPSESLSNKLFTNIDFSDVDDDSLSEATVTLTNAIDGDKINIAGDLKEGITYTTEYKDGKLIIKFTGIASHEAYEEALEAIRFSTKNSENERELKFDIEIKDPNGKTDKNSVVIIGKGFDNDAPTIGDERVETKEDISYTFSIKDFDSYKDVDGDSIETIKIVTLPDSKTEGVLKYDGVIITAGKEILVKDLGKLVFEPVSNNDKDASFSFQVSDDRGAYSDIKTMSVGVIAVADAPTVTINIVPNTDNSNNGSSTKIGGTDSINNIGTSGDDIIEVNKELVMNDKIDLKDGNDTLILNKNINQVTLNLGSGNDKVIINGQVNGTNNIDLGSGNDVIRINNIVTNNTHINGGEGRDILYLSGNQSDYIFNSQTNNNGMIEGSMKDKIGGGTIQYNQMETIVFGDGSYIGKEPEPDTSEGYKYDITVKAEVIDESEKLSDVTIRDIPKDSKLFGADGKEISANNDGSYTVKVDANGEAKLSLTSESEISQDKLDDVQVSATSTDKSTDGTSEVSQAISFDGSGDIDLSNLKNVITELKEINLENGKENKLSLTLDDVLKLSGDDNTIKITGDDNLDGVSFKNEDGKVWEQQQSITEGDKTFDVYSGSIGDQTVQVKVEQPISDGITC
ncbi:VCBS domain-containing protein, partial [Aliarcobacter butzleri]